MQYNGYEICEEDSHSKDAVWHIYKDERFIASVPTEREAMLLVKHGLPMREATETFHFETAGELKAWLSLWSDEQLKEIPIKRLQTSGTFPFRLQSRRSEFANGHVCDELFSS